MNRIFYVSVGCLTLAIGTFFSARAQDTTNTLGHVSIASPTAASLGKFGDIPVSYNTGLPSVGIPVYTVESGSLKLPVGLSYHASGLKVQENAGWVGAGWALNAGGVITRTVIGAADDRGISGYNNCTNGHYSDYGYNNYQFIGGSGLGDPNNLQSDDQAFEWGVKDAEPDLYFFNFGSYSGKFYFNDDQTPMFVPEQDFKVVPDLNNGTGGLGFQGFVVTTPDGVRYYFGKTGNNGAVTPVEVTVPSTLQNGPNTANEAVSSWYLNKIVSADGVDSITLSYTAERYSYYTISTFPVTNVQSGQTFLNPSNIGYKMIKNFVQGVRLSGISFPNGSVTFTRALSPRTDLSDYISQAFTDVANTESYALGSIQVSDTKGFCKKDSLYYGYFYDANAYTANSATYGGYNIHSDQYRLRLDSMQESSCDASLKIPPYTFTYFTELVPRKLSFGMDHWGFSNGNLYNQTLVPSYTLIDKTGAITQLSGANRDASWPAMRGGSLQQINYPTGGYTRMVFEPHNTYVQYTTYANSNVISGSVGYGGTTQTTGSFSTDGTSSTYVMTLSSAQTASGGDNFELKNSSGTVVQNWFVTSDSTVSFTFTLSPSSAYTWTYYSHATGTASFNLNERQATSVTGNATVGGLRIDSLINNDGVTATANITTYTYTNGGTQSSGILYSRPVYVQTIRNDIMGLVYGPDGGSLNGCVAPDFGDPQGSGGTYYISGGSITPMSTVQGNHIGYNQVQVTQSNNGYSIYRYYGSNTWDNLLSDVCTRVINTTHCSASIPNFPAPPQPYEYSRGELKYEGHFNQAGQVLKDATTTYSYAVDPITTPGIAFITIPGLYSYTGYSLQTARKTQTNVVSTSYDPSTSGAVTSTSTVYYGSNFHHQPTRNVVTTSTGDTLVTNTKYIMDFRVTSCDAIPDSLPYYNTAIHNDSVHLNSTIGSCPVGAGSGQWVCRYDSLQVFRQNVSRDRRQYITYRRRSYSDPGNLLSSCYLTAENGADALLKPVFRLQDEFNNAPIEVSEWKDLNLRHAYFTQYDTSLSPLGFAYPGRTQSLLLQATSATFTNATISGTTVSKDSRYADETVFKFSAGNPQQMRPHSGVTISYLWDYQNTKPIAKVTNATADQIAYTSFEADGSGTWTIGSGVRDTGSVTGTQSYNLAGGACSRSGLTSANMYIVSYWTTNASAYTITGTQGSAVQGRTSIINGTHWTYFEHKITGQSSVSIAGTGHIDELRLYPAAAQMISYTYQPVLGINSSSDIGSHISYYEYDKLGRLLRVRDMDYNILKQYDYQYKVGNTVAP